MTDIFSYLSERCYPGRGILLGLTPSGKRAAAYFIMGRSENSRNRVFTKTDDGIRTEAFDASKMTDPSLIIYRPVRETAAALIVTNGDQTDTIYEHLAAGGSYRSALRTRKFEPDGPNWTPRVSGVFGADGSIALSILKSTDGDERCCCRNFYEYDAPLRGEGRFISTYAGFGDPIPSFSGEPVRVLLTDEDAGEWAARLWNALNAENRVSLYASIGGEAVIINKNSRQGGAI